MTLSDRIAELVEQCGSLRAVARVLETDVGYLSRLSNGGADNPSAVLLQRMGLRRVVTYERFGARPAYLTECDMHEDESR